jgi:glycosyltransferase involved in cell wall biosynthesis
LEQELRELSTAVSAPVEFVGQLWGNEVDAEMLGTAALVVPSIWHEVSPLVVYQAMTLGVPVIASRVGGIPDLLSEGRGVMVAPGSVDALAAELARSVEDRKAFDAMACKALEYSRQELSRSRFVERISDAYREAGAPL